VNTDPAIPAAISPMRSVLRTVRNQLGRDKWDYPATFDGPRSVRISHRPQLHATMFPRSVAPEHTMWLDLPWDQVIRDDRYTSLDAATQGAIRHYYDEGYWRIDALFDADELDRVFGAYQAARDAGRLSIGQMDGVRGPRHLDPQRFVPEINELFADRRLMVWIDRFMGRASIPFQTIVGEWGTAQEIHTDAIHQTTFPLGFHVSAWLACEDIPLEAGALFFYPRSHRLSYALANDCGITPGPDHGDQYRSKYIPHIERVVEQHGLKREVFLARKGDVLMWHHNLLHGGSPIVDGSLTRKAMALFFYGKGALHYHDLSGDRAASPLS
jgi:hypothetical protein